MKRSCRRSSAAKALSLLACTALLAGCAGERAPKPAEWSPLAPPAHAAREPLPDDAERSAVRIAAAALAGRRADAEAESAALEREDAAREARGEERSGLADNAAELISACDGSEAFPQDVDELLARDDLDPALRRRLEHARDTTPLAIADTRLSEELRFKVGSLFNRIVEPLSTLAISGAINPVAAARGALSTLLTAWSFPSASPREREALHEYDEWLARHPESPDGAEVRAEADTLREKLARERSRRDLRGANTAAGRHEWDVVEILAGRALRQTPDSSEAQQLLATARSELAAEDARAHSSLTVRELVPASLSPEQSERYLALARATAVAPPGEVARDARLFAAAGAPAELAPELRLLESFEPLGRGDEDATAAALAAVPGSRDAPDTASRQAGALLADSSRNAWAHYLEARSADDRARWRWIALGQFANGFPDRGLWRPLETLLDVPGLAMTLASFPLRMIQYPGARSHFAGGVVIQGERYVARYPQGVHAEQVHGELEELYAQRGYVAAALRHAEARQSPDAKAVAGYRAALAQQLVDSSQKEKRVDVRLAYLGTVLREFGDTPAAKEAREKFHKEKTDASPQKIRLTHDFLVENPALWGPGALGIAPELLDGKRANGEIAERGVTLLGKNVIQLELEDREPMVAHVPPDDFARFVALLEETSRAGLERDEREKAVPDAARDEFLSDARLGLAGADPRSSARSEAVYQSTHEKYGFVHSRDSILPVDIVLQGDIDTLGLAAFPRIRMPEPAPDELLYE